MINLLTSELCKDCYALKTALTHEQIAYREIDIHSLGPEEIAEMENSAKHKLLNMRYSGHAMSMEQILCTPIVHLCVSGQAIFLFPVDLMDHGVARVEAMARIKAMLCG